MTQVDGRAADFPRQHARTRRFTLGHPRSVSLAPDGSRVVFLRSAAGDDPVLRLWVLGTAAGRERCVADPGTLAGRVAGADDELPAEERALRERTREAAGGIVAYATDRAVRVATFTLAGQLYVADLEEGTASRHGCRHTVTDPRPDPTGQRIAYVSGGGLHVTELEGGDGRLVAGPDRDEDRVTWGLAEFVAAEEMGRTRGYWWSPDGDRLAVARVDNTPVARWHVTDPADPAQPPRLIDYPAAGSDNADVSLSVVSLDGERQRIEWDDQSFPYLVSVVWREWGPLTLLVQSRDQRTTQVLAADPGTGATSLVRQDHDAVWVEIVAGVPRWTRDQRLVHTLDDGATRKLAIDGRPVTPDGLQIRSVVHAGPGGVTVLASGEDPTAVAAWQVPLDGGDPVALSPTEGVSHARVRGDTTVLQTQDLTTGGRMFVRSPAGETAIRSVAETPLLDPRPLMLTLGRRGLRAALLLPSGYQSKDGPLPVLLDPYGGPHAQRVLQRRDAFAVSQWFAEAGFAVLVTDGRGSPGRGPLWERAVAGDLGTAPLEDQIDALRAAAAEHPLDLGTVAIRGWSFGGYLAAAAVLRRPDVFHAAIAGAPVTDWSLYDTHYTERYLGTPSDDPAAYRASSLLDDVPDVKRPLLLIHGLADDNVVAAHTLRLSGMLVRHAHPHQVIPLTAVTHMTPQVTVAENLLWLELAFLRDALGLARS